MSKQTKNTQSTKKTIIIKRDPVRRRQASAVRPARRAAAPAAVGVQSRNRAPRISHRPHGIVVEHEEYVTDILSDVLNEFAYDTFAMQPGVLESFPWLSGLATQYESYQFEMLHLKYKPACGSSQGGQVSISIDYDPADNGTTLTKQELYNMEGTKVGPMWEELVLVADPKALKKIGPQRFTNTTSAVSSFEALRSAGNVYVATTQTNGLTAGAAGVFNQVSLGSFWIKYRVILETPQVHEANFSRPVLRDPQMSIGAADSGVDNVSSPNLLRKYPLTEAYGAKEQPTGYNPDDNTHFQIETVIPPAGALTSPTGAALPANEVVLEFKKDFQGFLNVAAESSSAFTTPPTNVIVEQYSAASNATTTAVNQISTPFGRPEFGANVINTVSSVVTGNTYNYLLRLAIQANTWLRVLSVASYVLGNAVSRTFRLQASKYTFNNSELLEMRANNLLSAPVKYTIAPGIKCKPHQIKLYLDWVAKQSKSNDDDDTATALITTPAPARRP